MADDQPRVEYTIARRFVGPVDMANGGYVGGLLAEVLERTHGEVRLRRPVPLEKRLHIERDAATARLLHEGDVVAEFRDVDFQVDVPMVVSLDDAARAAADVRLPDILRNDFDAIAESERCFGCGPRPDGLALQPGPVAGTDLIASPVRFPDDLVADGVVPDRLVWTALDCPSFWACWLLEDHAQQILERGIITGSFAVNIHRAPRRDERLLVQAWKLGEDGRKWYGAGALVTDAGEVLGVARQTAIVT